jgi:VRR-NUC domain
MAQNERIDHINTVNWFRHHFPELELDFHHFANERKFEKKGGAEFYAGKILKRMGVQRGVPDFFLAFPQNGKAGLWIELKVGTNKPSKEQKDFLARKTERGYVAVCVWGTEEAREIIKNYLQDYIASK